MSLLANEHIHQASENTGSKAFYFVWSPIHENTNHARTHASRFDRMNQIKFKRRRAWTASVSIFFVADAGDVVGGSKGKLPAFQGQGAGV
jgi:hypothetical protein